ncbi:MAG: XdhC/CoxI family protein [Myxococcota bacterium]|jgi:xanthine dehydrogenase accessory factor|nr:XdhC/CoxI family protein [Myxococcota bacterium]
MTDCLFEIAARWRQQKKGFVMAVVVETSGSTPREPGARMLIASPKETFGTVGGGVVERAVVEQGCAMLRESGPGRLSRFDLLGGEGSDGVCGGQMTVFLEPFPARCKVHLLGAGHVAEELAPLLVRLDMAVVIHDFREDRLARPAFAPCDRRPGSFESVGPRLFAESTDFAVIMTPSHTDDYVVLRQLVELDLAYLGVMSSKSKRGELMAHLEAEGVSKERRDRVTMPVGLPIGSKTPAEIAVSIAAEIVALRRGKSGGAWG